MLAGMSLYPFQTSQKIVDVIHCSSTVHPRPLFVHVSLKGTGNLREFAGMKTVDEQWTNSGRTVDEVRARPSRVNTERSLENVRCSP